MYIERGDSPPGQSTAENDASVLSTEVRRSTPSSPRRSWLHRVAVEPLTHFLILGAAIFAISHYLEERSTRYVIDVSPAEVTRIVNSYAQQYGARPSDAQVRTMVDNYIKEEIYLREGMALGLDKDDEIVRRRIAQKFEFLQQDMAAPREPAEGDLRAYYRAHLGAYRHPPKRSFDQIYFAMDQRGDAAARAAASNAVRRLSGSATPLSNLGDTFPGPAAIQALTEDEVSRLFGGDGFAPAVFAAPIGKWVGPVRSGYGWHLVRVTDAIPARQRSFVEAKNDVRIDWQQDDRATRNGRGYLALLKQYRVTRADGAR